MFHTIQHSLYFFNPIKYSGDENGNPLQYSCLKNSMGRGLMSYSLQGHKESDTTERLIHMKCLGYAFLVTLRVREFSILN